MGGSFLVVAGCSFLIVAKDSKLVVLFMGLSSCGGGIFVFAVMGSSLFVSGTHILLWGLGAPLKGSRGSCQDEGGSSGVPLGAPL